MSLDPLTFDNISQAQFQQIATKVQSATGIAITGNTGCKSAKGYTITWTFAEPNLTIQCIQKPALVPGGIVQSELKKLVAG